MHPFLNIAIKAAKRAGTIVLRSIDQLDRIEIATKNSSNDFVTSADHNSQADIIETITRAYPKHGILAEEGNSKKGQEDIVWIIDPIDGTLNFVHGLPHFAISIGIECKGIIEHGVIFDPVNNELFTASRGRGAYLNERRIRVSNCTNIEYALLASGFSFGHNTKNQNDENKKINLELERFYKLLQQCADVRIAGSAALNLAYVAAGRLDGYWECGLKPWDLAAGSLIVREAGGFVSDFQSENGFLQTGEIVAATRKIYAEIIKNLS